MKTKEVLIHEALELQAFEALLAYNRLYLKYLDYYEEGEDRLVALLEACHDTGYDLSSLSDPIKDYLRHPITQAQIKKAYHI